MRPRTFYRKLILNNFYIYIFSIECLIFEISETEEKFSQFLHKRPYKIRNSYNGAIFIINYLRIFWLSKFNKALMASVPTVPTCLV